MSKLKKNFERKWFLLEVLFVILLVFIAILYLYNELKEPITSKEVIALPQNESSTSKK